MLILPDVRATGGDCTANGGSYGIPDSVLMDSAGGAQKIFAFTGNDGNAGASATVAQLGMDLSGLVRVHIGLGSVGNNTTNVDIHSGAFDNNYFGATPSSGLLFGCGTSTTDTSAVFYWVGFTSYPTMNSTTKGTAARWGGQFLYSYNRDLQYKCELWCQPSRHHHQRGYRGESERSAAHR